MAEKAELVKRLKALRDLQGEAWNAKNENWWTNLSQIARGKRGNLERAQLLAKGYPYTNTFDAIKDRGLRLFPGGVRPGTTPSAEVIASAARRVADALSVQVVLLEEASGRSSDGRIAFDAMVAETEAKIAELERRAISPDTSDANAFPAMAGTLTPLQQAARDAARERDRRRAEADALEAAVRAERDAAAAAEREAEEREAATREKQRQEDAAQEAAKAADRRARDQAERVKLARCPAPSLADETHNGPETTVFETNVLPPARLPETVPGALLQIDTLNGSRDALRYIQTYPSWAAAFGGTAPPRNAPASAWRTARYDAPLLDHAISLAKSGRTLSDAAHAVFESNLANKMNIPYYVVDGTNVFYHKGPKWDIHGAVKSAVKKRGEVTKANPKALSKVGPVIVVWNHAVLENGILRARSERFTDANLKELDYFLCELHGGIYPVVFVDIHLLGCHTEGDTKVRGEDGYPCYQVNDGRNESECKVVTSREEEGGGRAQSHAMCEYDDTAVALLVRKLKDTSDKLTPIVVSGDRRLAEGSVDDASWPALWSELNRLGDRAHVRLYELVKRETAEASMYR